MDLSKLKEKIIFYIGKYKFVLLILCVGFIFILIPSGTTEKRKEEVAVTQNVESYLTETDLSTILSRIEGAGRVEVLLSLEYSAQTDYQLNLEESSTSSQRTTTVTVTDAQRNESGLVSKTCAPVYRGAIVVCDGADDPSVHLSVVNAVSSITGLRSNQISVLKME